jgi:hypothetical protein
MDNKGAQANLGTMAAITVGVLLVVGVVEGEPVLKAICLMVLVLGGYLVWQARHDKR